MILIGMISDQHLSLPRRPISLGKKSTKRWKQTISRRFMADHVVIQVIQCPVYVSHFYQSSLEGPLALE